MKTLEQIQQEVAEEHNCKDWTVLRNSLYGNRIKFDSIWLNVANRFAKEVAKETQRRCAENAKAESAGYSPAVYFCDCQYRVDKQSILDPKNLPI